MTLKTTGLVEELMRNKAGILPLLSTERELFLSHPGKAKCRGKVSIQRQKN